MKLGARWFDWEPSSETVLNYVRGSPTKHTKIIFEGFVGDQSRQTPTVFSLEAEPAAYQEAFQRWLSERCSLRDGLSWGMKALHCAYCLWCAQEGKEVPAGLDTFRQLLLEEGFPITENNLVYGLVPTKDLPSLPQMLRAEESA